MQIARKSDILLKFLSCAFMISVKRLVRIVKHGWFKDAYHTANALQKK